ncbi:unnamed protein product [Caenorhabditis auriculariae]|uniref:Uncharacterized protein n=1 Tax=Caenorhabditis auriculariae TaxID=2777116 RepID=A0A8S1H4I8_9PELO|nr:unnamed protein product [Caenorhabditis auriculariae]
MFVLRGTGKGIHLDLSTMNKDTMTKAAKEDKFMRNHITTNATICTSDSSPQFTVRESIETTLITRGRVHDRRMRSSRGLGGRNMSQRKLSHRSMTSVSRCKSGQRIPDIGTPTLQRRYHHTYQDHSRRARIAASAWRLLGVSRCKSGQRIPDIGTPTLQRRYHHTYQDHSRRARIAASAWRLLGETCGFLISGRRQCNVAITTPYQDHSRRARIAASAWRLLGVSRCKSGQRIPDIGTPTLQRRYHHTYQDHSRRARIAASAWRLLGETCGFLISGRRQCNVAITTLTKIIAGGLGLPPPRGAFWVRPGVSRCKSGQRIPDIGTPTLQRRYHHTYQDHSRRARIAASAWRLLGVSRCKSGQRIPDIGTPTLQRRYHHTYQDHSRRARIAASAWRLLGVSRCKSGQRIPDIGTPTLQRRYHHTYQDHSRRARIAASAWRLLGETCGFLISGRRHCNVAITTLTKIIAGGLGLPPPRGAFWVRPGVSRCKSGQRIPDIGTPTLQRRYHHPYQDHSRRARIAASAWRLLGETCGFLISGRRQCNVAITTLTKIIAGGLGLPPPRGAFWVRPGLS